MALDNFRTQKIIWDRANKKIFEKIEANAGDSNGRKLVVQVINQETTESLTGTTLSLGWKSRKGAKGLDTFNVVDASKGIFEIYYTTGMLSNIGNLEASLILINSTGRIESSTFTISVRPSTVDDEAVESENSFTALTEALVKVNDFDARLAQKVGGSKKAEPENLSERTLSLITGNGTINIESIPQDESVSPSKLERETKDILSLESSLATYKYHKLTDDDNRLLPPIVGGRTRIIGEPSTRDGVIKKIRATASANAVFIIKVMQRTEGKKFIPFSQETVSLQQGQNYIDVNIPIKKGMFIGYYSDEGSLRTVVDKPEDTYYIVGNSDTETEYLLTEQRMFFEAEIEYESLKRIDGGIPPQAIEGIKTTKKRTINLFNKEEAIQGGYYSPSTGEWKDDQIYFTSAFIPIEPNKRYKKSNTSSFVFWDENHEYVTGVTGGDVVSTIHTNVRYVTLTVHKTDLNSMMITLESEYTGIFTPYYVDKILLDERWDIQQSGGLEEDIKEIDNRFEVIENTYDKDFILPIELHLPDFSGYNQPYHPSVIYIEGGFGGYEYWLVQSPYPIGGLPRRDRWEVPIVYKSHDGIDWITVANPLDDITQEEITRGDYMSDPHIVYRPDTTTLEVWYRLTSSTSGSPTAIFRKVTQDGITWTEREEMIPPKVSTASDFWRSPSVMWDNERNLYRVWYHTNYGLYYNESENGIDWGVQQQLVTDAPHSSWHIDVNYFNNQYHLLSYSRDGGQDITYYVSDDGINFERQRKLLDIRDGNTLYSTGLYRAVSLLDGNGKARVYFTAETENRVTKIGLMIGDSINEMQGVQKLSSEMVVLNSGMTLEELYAEVVKLRNLVSQ